MNTTVERKNRKGKIVIIKGQSQYNVLRLACDLMAKGFEENGYQTQIIDALRYSTSADFMLDVIGAMVDDGLFIFSFNALYHDMHYSDMVSIYDRLQYKVLGLLVDHPYYHKSRVEGSQGDNIYLGCIDPDHVSYIRQYYPKIKNTEFLPHFSFQAEKLIPYDERKVDIYYPGSYKNPDEYKQNFTQLPQVFHDIAMTVFEMILQKSELTVEEALRIYLASVGFEYSADEFVEIVGQIYFVDHVVRDVRRDRIVRALIDAGIEVTVSGKGWAEMEVAAKDKLHILGNDGLDIEENVKLIADTKILFNTFPNFKNGTHERIFTAMRNGCVCLTDPSGFLLDKFQDQENLVYYDISRMDLLPNIVKNLLKQPEKSKQIAMNGYNIACIDFDEKNTTKRFLDFLGLD